MNGIERLEIAKRLSNWYNWYCMQDGAEDWLGVNNKKYVSMVSLFGKNKLILERPLDVFKLFVLGLTWNSKKYGSRFEVGLSFFRKLDDSGILNQIYDNAEIGDMEIDEKFISSYRYLRNRWDNLYRLIRSSDFDPLKFIKDLKKDFSNRHLTTPFGVKIFLVLREMKSQEVLDVSDDFCCVPDQNVRKMMYATGLSDKKWKKWPTIVDMIGISKEVSFLFNNGEYKLYDMPLFWFYRKECAKLNSCTERCILYDVCAKRK